MQLACSTAMFMHCDSLLQEQCYEFDFYPETQFSLNCVFDHGSQAIIFLKNICKIISCIMWSMLCVMYLLQSERA